MLRGARKIPIQRQTKEEIDQAIQDLEERGFIVSFGPVEQHRNSRVLSKDGVEHHGVGNSMWKAMMEHKED